MDGSQSGFCDGTPASMPFTLVLRALASFKVTILVSFLVSFSFPFSKEEGKEGGGMKMSTKGRPKMKLRTHFARKMLIFVLE
jgi:hypothetical protein